MAEMQKLEDILLKKETALPNMLTEEMYQVALEFGRQGAVEEILGNLDNALDYYSHGAVLLRWLAGENGTMDLPMNLQRLKEEDCSRLVKYAQAIERRRARCENMSGHQGATS